MLEPGAPLTLDLHMSQTPGADTYFNSASHGLPPPGVYHRIARHMSDQARIGAQAANAQVVRELSLLRDNCARLLATTPDRIGFTSTTTAAFHALTSRLDLAGKRVLVTEHDWGDYYRFLSARSDVTVQTLPPLDLGAPDLSQWADLIDESVAAIFVPMQTCAAGLRYPVEAIGALPRPDSTMFIVDAAQALGQIGVDVGQINCDGLISTCRKWLRGPRQTALFWIGENWRTGGQAGDASALQPADQEPALLLGLGVSVANWLDQGPEVIQTALTQKSDRLRHLATQAGFSIFGGDPAHSATVSIELPRAALPSVMSDLQSAGYQVKSPDIARFEPLFGTAAPPAIIRLSPHVYTSDTALDGVICTAKSALQKTL